MTMKLKAAFAAALVAAGSAQAFWPFTTTAMKLDEVSMVALPDEWVAKTGKPVGNWGTYGACDLTNAITRMTGKAVALVAESVVPADAKNVLYLGPTETAKKTMDGLMDYMSQEFRIRTEKGRIVIGAPNPTATTYAVGEFLGRFCDYWFVTIAGNDPLPEDRNPAIAVADVRLKPAMSFRYIEHCMYNGRAYPTTKRLWEIYNRRLRLEQANIEQINRFSWSCGKDCHTYFRYCDPKKYYKDHPEYYSVHPNGERHWQPTGQLCLSNPDVYKIVLESLKAYVEKDRKGKKPGDWPLLYDFSQEDNTSWLCNCEKCKAIAAKYNRIPGGHYDGGDCGLQLEFVNRLARDIRAIYPDVWIRTFAYVSTETPPKDGTIVPEPNVLIWLCDLYGDSNHEYPLESARNRHRADIVKAWSKLARRMEIWDYMLYGNGCPEVNVDALAADAKFFRSVGLDRVFFEDHATAVRLPCFWELNNFVRGQCMFNPDVDLEMLIGKFCRVYGKAAPKMVKAINWWREVVKKDMPTKFNLDKIGRPHFQEKMIYARHSEADMLAFAALLQAAYDELEPGEARGRVAQALASVWGNLRERYGHDFGDEAAKKRGEALEKFRGFAIEYATTAKWVEPRHVDGYVSWCKGLKDAAPLRFADLPAELAKLPPNDVVCVGPWNLDAEDEAVRINDPEAFDNRASVLRLGKRHDKREYGCGIYDRTSTEWTKFKLKAVEPNDEKYHWYHLGEAHIGNNSIFYLPEESWSISMYLKDFFVNSDGLVDNNWYDFWVSAKFAGPDYVAGSTKTNGVYVNRMIMRRTPKEQAR